MTSAQQKEKQRRIEAAMFPLVADSRFNEFIDVLRELKDEAVLFAVSHDSAKDARATTRVLGEISAYCDIISVADNYRTSLEEKREEAYNQ